MKVLYCKKCNDLFKLTHRELRTCRCGKVAGKYRKDKHHADVSPNALSIKIHNDSLKDAIARMQLRQREKPKSKDKDYQIFSAVAAWVRPNFGPGNRRTHPLKKRHNDE